MQTQGFQLSQFERAPQLSGDIGKVDVKSIYDNVVNALKTYETTAAAPARQAATEAGLNYETQRAQTEQGLLGVEGAARRAKANLLSADSAAQMGLLSTKTDAERAKYQSDIAKGTYFSDPNVWKMQTENKMASPAVRTLRQLNEVIQNPNTPEDLKIAAKAAAKWPLTPEEQSQLDKQGYKVRSVVDADGYTHQFTSNGSSRILGIPGSETGDFLVSRNQGGAAPQPAAQPAPAATPAVLRTPAPATPAAPEASAAPTETGLQIPASTFGGGGSLLPTAGTSAIPLNPYAPSSTRMQRQQQAQTAKSDAAIAASETKETAAEKQFEHRLDEKEFERALSKQDSLAADYNALQNLEAKSRSVDSAINQAIIVAAQEGFKATGGGPVGAAMRATKLSPSTAKFQSLLTEIRSNIGFDTLQQMRQNSKTGGALGNVSDNEGVRLESVFGNLSQDLSDKDMIDTLVKVREARRTFLKQSQDAYARAKMENDKSLTRIRPELVRNETLEKDANAVKWAHENPNDPRAAEILKHATNQ